MAPPILALQDAGQKILFLLIGAIGHDDIGHHDKTKGNHIGDARQRALGFIDILLRGRPACPAELDRPIRRNPAFVIELALPFFGPFFMTGAHSLAQLRRIRLLKKVTYLVAES